MAVRALASSGLALLAAGAAAGAAAAAPLRARSAASKLLWSVSDANQIYGSASVARNRGGATFAVGTDFGSAQYVDVVTQAGKVAFRVAPSGACSGACSLYVDQARHTGAADPGAPAIDTFVLQVGDGNCTVMGFVSAGPGATGAPAWTTAIEDCNAGEGVGGTYRCFEASDDGSMAVLSAYHKIGGDRQRAAAYAFDGQTGKLRWDQDLKVEAAGQGDIWLTSPDGAFVAFVNEDSVPTPNSAQMHVLLGASGKVRAEVQMPFFIAGDISDDGNYIAIQNFTHLVGSEGWILKWSGSKYELVHRLKLPDDGSEYDEWDTAFTTASDGSAVAVMGWIEALTVKRLRVNSWNAATGALLADWSAPPNSAFQNNPTIRCAGDYVAVALWGDNGNEPTCILMTVHSNKARLRSGWSAPPLHPPAPARAAPRAADAPARPPRPPRPAPPRPRRLSSRTPRRAPCSPSTSPSTRRPRPRTRCCSTSRARTCLRTRAAAAATPTSSRSPWPRRRVSGACCGTQGKPQKRAVRAQCRV